MRWQVIQRFPRSDESRYFRFMDPLRELTPRRVSHFTTVDHDRHLALIAVREQDGKETQVGVARYLATPERTRCEFSIVVADEWQRKGLGTRLMLALIAAARAAGVSVMHGEVLAGNHRMLRFAAGLGFAPKTDRSDPRILRVELPLQP